MDWLVLPLASMESTDLSQAEQRLAYLTFTIITIWMNKQSPEGTLDKHPKGKETYPDEVLLLKTHALKH